ncbi:MAG TPA: hypothetical protein VE912_12510 [Bacteroidales bacterium]|nr:hypothetical protein [Bacteroidales bacterium]
MVKIYYTTNKILSSILLYKPHFRERKWLFNSFGVLFLIIFELCFVKISYAQNSIDVVKVNDLSFGSVVAGDAKTVYPDEPSAALFQIAEDITDRHNNNDNNNNHGYHYGWQSITVTFHLPTVLTDGIHSIPVDFNSNSAMWSDNNNSNGARKFDPKQDMQFKLHYKKPIYIWLGGTARTNLSQWSGHYQGTITLSVTNVDN